MSSVRVMTVQRTRRHEWMFAVVLLVATPACSSDTPASGTSAMPSTGLGPAQATATSSTASPAADGAGSNTNIGAAGARAVATAGAVAHGPMSDAGSAAVSGGAAQSMAHPSAGASGPAGAMTGPMAGSAGTATADNMQDAGAGGAGAGASGAGGSSASNPDPSAITNIKVSASGFDFDVRAAGPETGELVILLHGFPETSYEWHNQLSALGKAGYRALAPDQRGYSPGARPSAVDDYRTQLLAADVAAIADAVGVQRFHVVGHDWGASVAWMVAHYSASRVISLSALSVPHPDAFAMQLADHGSCQYSASSYFDFFSMANSQDQLLANNAALLRGLYSGIDAAVIDEYLRVLNDNDALRSALNWYRANVGARMLNQPMIGNITVPTLMIWSDRDTALCRQGVDATQNFVTGPYMLEIINGVDHWMVDRVSDRVTELLSAHLDQYREKK